MGPGTPANSPTYDVKSFLGIRNTGRSRMLPPGSLAAADNVDIDDEGFITLRRGYTSALSLTSITAAYSPLHENFAYVVANGVLYRVDMSLHAYAMGNVSTDYTYWAEAGNMVFLSTGYIANGSSLIPWSVNRPSSLLVRTGIGSLPAGRYLITATQTTADGRESSICSVNILELTDNQSIHIDNAAGKNIYVSEPNGEVLYLVGTGVEHITDVSRLAVPLLPALYNNYELPANISVIAFYDAAVYVAVYDQVNNQTVVYFSKPYLFHVFDLFQDYFILPDEVRAMVSANGKLTLGTSRKIYEYDGSGIQVVAEYGVPRGRQAAVGRNGYTMIYTNRGPCTCAPFTNLTLDKVSLPPGYSVSAAVMEIDGTEKFIVLTDGSGTANNKV